VIRLVALDIDGTVVRNGDRLPSERTTASIRRLAESGVSVVLASGRMFPGTARIHEHLGLSSPLICQQGCSIHAPDGSTLHEVPLAREVALEIVDYARGLDLPYEWFNPVRYLASRKTPQSEVYSELSGIAAEYLEHPEHSGVVPTGVGIISSAERANSIHRHMVNIHGEKVHMLDFPEVTVGVAPAANKATALEVVCAELGIHRHQTLTVGDSVNDAPMLAWSPNSYAMPGSDGYARDAARYQLDEAAEPLAELLESLVR
jgi:HAD superfamily hydrolase (TIGR01484 family)